LWGGGGGKKKKRKGVSIFRPYSHLLQTEPLLFPSTCYLEGKKKKGRFYRLFYYSKASRRLRLQPDLETGKGEKGKKKKEKGSLIPRRPHVTSEKRLCHRASLAESPRRRREKKGEKREKKGEEKPSRMPGSVSTTRKKGGLIEEPGYRIPGAAGEPAGASEKIRKEKGGGGKTVALLVGGMACPDSARTTTPWIRPMPGNVSQKKKGGGRGGRKGSDGDGGRGRAKGKRRRLALFLRGGVFPFRPLERGGGGKEEGKGGRGEKGGEPGSLSWPPLSEKHRGGGRPNSVFTKPVRDYRPHPDHVNEQNEKKKKGEKETRSRDARPLVRRWQDASAALLPSPST